MIDIYTKRNIEVNYRDDKLDELDPIKIYIQKIKMILFTSKGEIIGDSNFGVDLERLLFKKNLNNEQIKKEIQDQIGQYCSEYSTYDTLIDVKFYKFSNRDECEINIRINNIDVISIRTF